MSTATLPTPSAPDAEAKPSRRRRVDTLTASRLKPWNPLDRVTSWYWAGAVTLVALLLRMVNIQHPGQIIFDETYYANDARDFLDVGYELNDDGGAGISAHPPMGKWSVAFGEWLFGYNSFGWRFSAVLAGVISVLILTRLVRRMFRSTLLGCVAGGLLAVEGLHFVSSRTALLDIFLMLYILAAFACLVMDRDQRRAQLYRKLRAGVNLRRGTPRSMWREWPWWKFAAAVFLGLAVSVKWSALWFIIALVVLVIVWEIQTRRSAGVRHPFLEVAGWESFWLLACGVIIIATHLATWVGWFASDDAYMRHWAEENNAGVWYLPDAIVSLWHYQSYIYEFHTNLDSEHSYQSSPLSWITMERPVLYYAENDEPCGADSCRATISGMGTPLLWWSFLPAWIVSVWQWFARRDWRAGVVVLMGIAGFVPWMFYPDRTMFFFYTLPAVPFLVIGVTLTLGMILGSPQANTSRRLIGGTAVLSYLIVIVMTFVYFYPLLTGESLPLDQWEKRIWVESWR